ncbi:Mobile element protein [Clostridiaceae bacterium JG1575]|nr:Mobile element protein [Clostridiaceae bacterium JG1575]
METEHVVDLLEMLGLPSSASALEPCLNEAARQDSTYLSFLTQLLEAERHVRQRRSLETRLKLSRLPQQKRLEGFDFKYQSSIDERQIRELASLAFAARKENLIFLGPPGVGKSHLGIALCMEAIQKGMTAYFTSMDRLLADLSKAEREGQLERRWKVYRRPDILMIDEIGYSRLKQDTGNLFFQLVCMRYEQGSMILTSTKGFGDWGDLMGDTALATAILDRLLNHAHVVNIRGDSYRMKERKKTGGLFTPAPPLEQNPILISGQN